MFALCPATVVFLRSRHYPRAVGTDSSGQEGQFPTTKILYRELQATSSALELQKEHPSQLLQQYTLPEGTGQSYIWPRRPPSFYGCTESMIRSREHLIFQYNFGCMCLMSLLSVIIIPKSIFLLFAPCIVQYCLPDIRIPL